MQADERLRAAAAEFGTMAFNAVSEGDVAAVHARVFPAPTQGVHKTGELTLCRLALCCKAMAAAAGLAPVVLWVFMKSQSLGHLLERELTTDRERAAWRELEGRLLAVAFDEG